MAYRPTPLPRQLKAFTLVELAVGVAIIALLLGMLMVPLGTQMDQRRISETQQQIDQIREAIIGFAIATGRLPCPAIATTVAGTVGAGAENKPGLSCGSSEGVIPWATLGVPETDAWGRRFTYRVDSNFADDPSGTLASFSLSDIAGISVTDGSVVIAANVPAVVVSHGKNGFGAFQQNGTQLPGAAAHELENANGDVTFVSRTNAPDFDDLLGWVSPNILKSRMVAGNRLP